MRRLGCREFGTLCRLNMSTAHAIQNSTTFLERVFKYCQLDDTKFGDYSEPCPPLPPFCFFATRIFFGGSRGETVPRVLIALNTLPFPSSVRMLDLRLDESTPSEEEQTALAQIVAEMSRLRQLAIFSQQPRFFETTLREVLCTVQDSSLEMVTVDTSDEISPYAFSGLMHFFMRVRTLTRMEIACRHPVEIDEPDVKAILAESDQDCAVKISRTGIASAKIVFTKHHRTASRAEREKRVKF